MLFWSDWWQNGRCRYICCWIKFRSRNWHKSVAFFSARYPLGLIKSNWFTISPKTDPFSVIDSWVVATPTSFDHGFVEMAIFVEFFLQRNTEQTNHIDRNAGLLHNYDWFDIMMMFKLIVSLGEIVISLKVLLDHYISKSMPFFLKQRACTYLVRSLLYEVSLLTDKKCVVIGWLKILYVVLCFLLLYGCSMHCEG